MRFAKATADGKYADAGREPIKCGDMRFSSLGIAQAGLCTRGALWLPDTSDSTVILGLLGPFFRGHLSTGNCGCWYFAVVMVADGSVLDGGFSTPAANTLPADTLSPFRFFRGKSRTCEGDVVTFEWHGDRGDGHGDFDFAWGIPLTDSFGWQVLGTTSDDHPQLWQFLYICAWADPTSPEAQLHNWQVPGPNTTQFVGWPKTVWDATNTYPFTWAGAIPLAQAFTDAHAAIPMWGTYAWEEDYVPDGGAVSGASFDPGEIGSGTNSFMRVESPDLPASVVAGVPFDFTLIAKDDYAGGSARFMSSIGRAVEGDLNSSVGYISDGTENSLYAPGHITESGTSGIYTNTGFKIKVAGIRRIRVHDGGHPGSTPRLQPVEVLPAVPKRIETIGAMARVMTCGDFLRGSGIRSRGSGSLSDFRPEVLAGLDATKGWHATSNGPAIQVVKNTPLRFEVLDEFFNTCHNDNTSQWTLSIKDWFFPFDWLGGDGRRLTGTLTRTAVKGIVTFDDVRAFGWGDYLIHIEKVGDPTISADTLVNIVGVPHLFFDPKQEQSVNAEADVAIGIQWIDVFGNVMLNNKAITVVVTDGSRPGSYTGVGTYVIPPVVARLIVSGFWLTHGLYNILFNTVSMHNSQHEKAYSPSFNVVS